MKRAPHEMYGVFLYRNGVYLGKMRFIWPWQAQWAVKVINLAYKGDEWAARLDSHPEEVKMRTPIPVERIIPIPAL